MPTPASSGFSSGTFANSSSGNAGASSIYLSKVTIPRAPPTGIDAILLGVTSAFSGSVKALIYDNTGTSGAPGALKATSVALTTLAAGFNLIPLTATVTLAPGTYYVGYVSGAAGGVPVPVDLFESGSSWFVSGGQSVTSPANPLVGGSTQSNALQVALRWEGSTAPGFGFATDYTAGVVLSASNTVATLNAAITEIARSVLARSSADATKFYAEMLVTGTVGSGTTTGVGLVSALYNDNAPSATPYHGIWLFGNDQILTAPGTSAATGPSFVSGDTIGIAYDAVAGFMWFNKNGGAWFGNAAGADPTAGASGHGFGMVAGWPILVAAASSSATIFTLRDTAAAQHYTMPTGYVAWSSAAGPPPASSLLRPPPLWVPSDVGDGDLALLQARARFLATPPVIVSGARPWFMVLT